MKAFLKTLVISLQFVVLTSVLSIGFGFLRHSVFTFLYVFNACFLVGAVIICVALIIMFMPAKLKFGKLTDHTTFGQRYTELHAHKQEKAYGFLFLGITVIVLTGLIQLVLALLIPL